MPRLLIPAPGHPADTGRNDRRIPHLAAFFDSLSKIYVHSTKVLVHFTKNGTCLQVFLLDNDDP
jgi:hypothetical protein